jgi:hypothetical protein
MPASSNSPITREEFCERTVQVLDSCKLTTPRRNIFNIDLSESDPKAKAGQGDLCRY